MSKCNECCALALVKQCLEANAAASRRLPLNLIKLMQALGVEARIASCIYARPPVWRQETAAVGCPLKSECALLKPVGCTGCQQHEPLDALQKRHGYERVQLWVAIARDSDQVQS